MAETLRPDICVIGAGAGGLSVAAAAAAFGVSVVLVEKGRAAGRAVNDMLAGNDPKSVTFTTVFHEGNTTAPPTP